MSLIEALLREDAVPKAIIMAGGAGAGKSYVSNQFISIAEENGWQYFNPDKYARAADPSQRLPLATASKKTEEELGAAVTGEAKPNIIWDTTANNESKVLGIKENGYITMMVMVYSHPMASFQANFDRAGKEGEESLPSLGVFQTWIKAYNSDHIKTYQEAFGENFMLIDNTSKPGVDMKMIADFNKAAQAGPQALQRYVEGVIANNPEKYSSSQFKQDAVELPDEVQEAFEAGVVQAGITFQNEKEEEKLKKAALKYYEKSGDPMPPAKVGRTNGMEETLESIRKRDKAAAETKKKIYIELAEVMQDVVEADTTVDEAVAKVKDFINS